MTRSFFYKRGLHKTALWFCKKTNLPVSTGRYIMASDPPACPRCSTDYDSQHYSVHLSIVRRPNLLGLIFGIDNHFIKKAHENVIENR